MTKEELEQAAKQIESGELPNTGWQDAPEEIPHVDQTELVSLRISKKMLAILKEFARREGFDYQFLLKRWLTERILVEKEKITSNRGKKELQPNESSLLQPKRDVEEGASSDTSLFQAKNLANLDTLAEAPRLSWLQVVPQERHHIVKETQEPASAPNSKTNSKK